MTRSTAIFWYTFAVHLTLASATLSFIKLKGPPSLPPDASPPLNPALGSFSIETAFFEEFFGNETSPNTLSLNLLQNLKARTGVPPEIRIGGITADSTHWNASQQVALSNFIDSTGALHNTTLGPAFWRSVGLLPTGTKITMNLVRQQSCLLILPALGTQIKSIGLGKLGLRRSP
jgi:hypothetical protein